MKTFFFFSIYLFTGISIYGQYYPDRHNNSYTAGWISCEEAESPNPDRGDSHWIMYDFGETYGLGKTHIWNTNVYGYTNVGIKDMIIDYSDDGVHWQPFGEVEIGQATASSFYTGEEGPDLDGIAARYLLITAKTNYGGECVGFSEIKFNTTGIISDTEDTDILPVELSAFPMPMQDFTNIQIKGIHPGPYSYQITNLSGQVILQKSIMIQSQEYQIRLDAGDWVEGVYLFTLSNGRYQKSITIEKLN